VLRGSDAIVAQSINTRDNVRKYHRFPGPIEVIPLGIRQPVVPARSRQVLGLPEGVFLGVTVGRLIPRKRIDLLLRALSRPENATVHLVIIGTGPEMEPLMGLAAHLRLGPRVMFAGHVEEARKWQLLQASDAYLSATMHEGFGLVFLEAMAAGLPIVCPDYGGQTDFLRDGETGFLVPAGDEGALSAAIAGLHQDRSRALSMGRSNLALAPRYRIELCAKAYEQLFARVVQQRVPTQPDEWTVSGLEHSNSVRRP
jgi:glycosyltransferase involved in cell wall biosynthesis